MDYNAVGSDPSTISIPNIEPSDVGGIPPHHPKYDMREHK